MIELLLFLHLAAVNAVPPVEPSGPMVTIDSSFALTTPAPTLPPHHGLLRRDVSSNVCGWVDGDVLSCDISSATCLWNPVHKIVGCGHIDHFPSATACVDYAAASTGASNPNIQTCSSTAPVCNTAYFPSSYSMFPCGPAKLPAETVALTYNAAPTPIFLPRIAGTDGKIVVETITPASMTCTISASSPTLVCKPLDMDNSASIIAACIGGGVLLLGLPFGIKMIIRKWKWKQEEPAPKRRRYPFGRQQAIPVEGPNFLFSQEWQGKQYEQTKQPPPKTKPKNNGPYMNT